MMTATQTMTYAEKLKHPLWQKKRLEVLSRDKWSCLKCAGGISNGKTLHVHHIIYVFGRDPWDYEDSNFETLCLDCHADRHDKEVKPEPLIGTSAETDSMNAAFTILYSDLNKEIARLISDNVEVPHQVNFITQYENVHVENYLVIESINDSYTASMHRKAVKMAAMLRRPAPTIEQFTYTRYFDMRTLLIKRVLQEIINNSMEDLKKEHTPAEQTEIQVWVQKMNRLKMKFFQSIKTV